MKCNLGKTDRIIRGILGTGIIALGFYFQNWFGAIGAILLVTAMISWCPIYLPFGLRSCKR